MEETVILWDHIKAKETFYVVNQHIKKENLPGYEEIDKMYDHITRKKKNPQN